MVTAMTRESMGVTPPRYFAIQIQPPTCTWWRCTTYSHPRSSLRMRISLSKFSRTFGSCLKNSFLTTFTATSSVPACVCVRVCVETKDRGRGRDNVPKQLDPVVTCWVALPYSNRDTPLQKTPCLSYCPDARRSRRSGPGPGGRSSSDRPVLVELS